MVYMDKELEICTALNNLINGLDYASGTFNFSDKVDSSLKVISISLNGSDKTISLNNPVNRDWEVVTGSFEEISSNIKEKYPDHLVIIQNGYYFEVVNEDVNFIKERFGFKPFQRGGGKNLFAGFTDKSKSNLSALRDMNKSFVLVCQLPEKKNGKVQRAICEVFNAKEIDSFAISEIHSENIFKIEAYSKVRLLSRLWRGKIEDVVSVRQFNKQNGRFLNSGLPFTVEEVELFDKWVEQGKTKDELENYFQRDIINLYKFLKKSQERQARGYREYYWE